VKARWWIIIACACAVLALVMSGTIVARRMAQDKDKPATTTVTIDNFRFTPASMSVKAGTTVRWTNRDDIPHTIVADDQSFKSKALDTDDGFSYTFSKPGTYSYFCSLHPKMTGKIVVQ